MSNVELVSIERVNNPTFDEADPQKRRTIVLLGVTTYNNIPHHELVVGTNKNDDVIRDLEQQLLSLRRSQENELKTQRERLRVEYDTEINGLRSRLDYMTSKEQTFYEDRDRYAMEMVDRCMIYSGIQWKTRMKEKYNGIQWKTHMKEKYNGVQWKTRMKVMNEGETQWNTVENTYEGDE